MNQEISEEEKANWHPGEEGHMGENEAHDEANMLRVKLEQWKIKEPSEFAYDQALEAIEKLQKAAADETQFKKVLMEVMRTAAKPVQFLFEGLDSVGLSNTPAGTKTWNEMRESRTRMLDDAAKELRDMHKAGEKFSK